MVERALAPHGSYCMVSRHAAGVLQALPSAWLCPMHAAFPDLSTSSEGCHYPTSYWLLRPIGHVVERCRSAMMYACLMLSIWKC